MNAVNLIADQTKLNLIKLNSDKDQIPDTVFKLFNSNEKSPCGQIGSVDERVKGCSNQLASRKKGFAYYD